MTRIIVHDDIFESLQVSEDEDEEFYDFMVGVLDAYEEGGSSEVLKYITHLVEQQT